MNEQASFYQQKLEYETDSWDLYEMLDREENVVYCDGIGCNASTKGSLNLSRLGFKVRELMGGLDWWKRDGYQTEGTSPSQGKEVVCGC